MQDSRGFVWIGTIYGLNRYDGYNCKSYLPNLLDEWSLHSTIITFILEDQNGLLWLGTDNGITIFNPVSEKFIDLRKLSKDHPTGIIRELIVDGDNNIWCLLLKDNSNILYQISNSPEIASYLNSTKANKPSILVNKIDFPTEFGNKLRFFSKTDDFNCLLANQEKQFISLNLKQKTFQHADITLPLYHKNATVTSLIFSDHDFSDRLAPDERYGILKSPDGNEFLCQFFEQRIFRLPPGPYPINSTEVSSLPVSAQIDQPQSPARIIDRNGKIWLGTIGDGVRIIEPSQNDITYQQPGVNICNPSIMPGGNLWAGMYEPNKVINLENGSISTPVWTAALPPGARVNAAYFDSMRATIYLILSTDQKMNLSKFNINEIKISKIEELYFNTNDPVILQKDSKENLWIAGAGGEIIQHNTVSGSTNHWKLAELNLINHTQSNQMARCITEDKVGRIWIGGDAGLVRISLNGEKPEFKAFNNYGDIGPIFKSNWIFSIYPDPEDAELLWLGTMSGGLAQFHCKTGSVKYLTDDCKPGFNVVTGILPDLKGNLWLATDKGVFKYQPKNNVFIDFTSTKNIPKIDLNAAAYIKYNEGNLLFGGVNGLLKIRPSELKAQTTKGELLITNLEINKQSLSAGISNGKIVIKNQKIESLSLSHNDGFVVLEFSTPDVTNPKAIIYRYRIKEMDDKWIYIGHAHSLTFNRFSPGNYTLEIQAIGEEESWNDSKTLQLAINVSPPWYRSNIANAAYLILLLAIIWAGFRYQRRRMALQHLAALNQKEVERLQSMDDFKNRFFAYIAHEFKTPLTIIMGTGEQLKRFLVSDNGKQYQQTILREGNNMLNLINELIDVTRLQDKSIQLNYEHCDLVKFMMAEVNSHKSLAELKGISMILNCEMTDFFAEIDPVRTQYILNNLLMNAIQHTQTGGFIIASLQKSEDNFAIIKIIDNGKGISPENLEHIFEKYFTSTVRSPEYSNFGLGLSFVKELTSLLNGTISVESNPGISTTFALTLPVKATADFPVRPPKPDFTPIQDLISVAQPTAPQDAPSLLVVEDNPALISYLKTILQPHFQITIATNGRDGLEIALQEIPDLILTDVMMPEMDGIEMTQKIKAHQLTNHIPIVILSAKNEVADRIKGHQQGADVYLGKPINEQELLLTLLNLFQLTEQWKKRYSSLAAGNTTLEKIDDMPEGFDKIAIFQNDSFMQQILNTFEANYRSENFDAPQLASIMNISKAQLYRKVAKISEEGVMGMLRNYRLNKAVEMLENYPNMSTKEIAFHVGFKEYSHFSVSFKKQFNINPSDWRKKSFKSPGHN